MKWIIIIISLAIAASPLPAEEPKPFVLYSGLYQTHPAFMTIQDKLKEAFKRNGYTLIIKNLPLKRALYMANKRGDGDVARVGNLKEIAPLETDNLIKIPVPVYKNSFSVFVLEKNKFQVNGWKSLSHFKSIGYPRGTISIIKNLPRAYPVDSETQLFQMLLMGRIEAAIVVTTFGKRVMSRPEFQNIVILSPPVHIECFHTYIHKKHKSFVPILAETLIQIDNENMDQEVYKKSVPP